MVILLSFRPSASSWHKKSANDLSRSRRKIIYCSNLTVRSQQKQKTCRSIKILKENSRITADVQRRLVLTYYLSLCRYLLSPRDSPHYTGFKSGRGISTLISRSCLVLPASCSRSVLQLFTLTRNTVAFQHRKDLVAPLSCCARLQFELIHWN